MKEKGYRNKGEIFKTYPLYSEVKEYEPPRYLFIYFPTPPYHSTTVEHRLLLHNDIRPNQLNGLRRKLINIRVRDLFYLHMYTMDDPIYHE